MGDPKGRLTWILVVCLCMNAAYTHAWGSYVCDLKDQGFQKIEEICSESATKVGIPFSSMENKLERILDFVEEIKTAEDSWLHITKKSGMVERDLSRHDDDNRHEQEGDNRRGEDQIRNQDDGNRNNRYDNRNRNGDETRTEDGQTYGDDRQNNRGRTNEYDRQNRRDRTDENDRQNRRDRTDENDRQNRRDRTDENDRQNRMERTEQDDRQNRRERTDENEDDRRRPERRDEDDTGPKKGECLTQVLNSHETIGMFYMMSYQHGHCANRIPISEPIRYCLGYCTSKTFIERESGIWSQGNDCKSCQPTRFETLRIPLTCDDGFTFEKKFKNVVDCKCQRCQPVEKNKKNA